MAAVPEIARVSLGLENDHEIFHATTEPYGLIEGTVERSAVAASSNGRLVATA